MTHLYVNLIKSRHIHVSHIFLQLCPRKNTELRVMSSNAEGSQNIILQRMKPIGMLQLQHIILTFMGYSV